MTSGDAVCAEHHCITCADDGVAMRVDRVDERRGLALCVDHQGSRSTVETALVEPVRAGDVLLVHAGTAIAALAGNEADTSAPNAGHGSGS
jgi:hydrogenase maturation factor